MYSFHNLGVLLVYAVAVSFLLHLRDSLIFASVGFAALVFSQVLAVGTMCKTENVEGEDSEFSKAFTF